MSSTSESQTRRDLLQTIEAQKESISKYERRLRDVVRAYKGIAKEKEALEDTLKALTKQEDDDAPDDADNKDAKEDDSKEDATEDDASSNASGSETGRSKKGSSEAKVRTLTASIATLTIEKSRLEADFQEDRRKMVKEAKAREKKLEELGKELERVKDKSKKDVEEAKSKLIIERHEREKETSDHAVMLRELQKIVADERRGREKAEAAKQELEERVKLLETSGSKNEEQERKVKVLEGKLKFKADELDKLNRTLKEVKAVEVAGAKKQLEEAREARRREVEEAERKKEAAEETAIKVRVEQEERVRALEARLHELSETVGTYDRLRQHDMVEMNKLREQLHEANNKESSAKNNLSEVEENDKDVQAMLDRFYRLKTSIKEANTKASNPVDLESLLQDEAAANFKKKYEEVKSELDEMKRRRGEERKSASPTTTAGRSGLRYLLPEVDQEVVLSLRTQISELQDKVALLRTQLLEKESLNSRLVEKEKEMQATINTLKASSKERLESVESDFRAKVLGLETELQKQRDRCLTLIEEKEDEVNMLKSNMEMAFEKTFAAATAAANTVGGDHGQDGGAGMTPERERELQLRRAAASSIASTVGSGRKSRKSSYAEYDGDGGSLTDRLKSSSPTEGMVLHYVQELSHKDVEIGNLRRQVFEIEAAMRELQMSAVAKEEKYVDQIDTLNDTVARLKRMGVSSGSGGKSDGGVSMEYLKNVVLSYMLSSDANSRDHMLKAIGAVLFFSKQEVKQVRDYNLSWFWTHSQVAASKKGHK